jgi:hypothetical protein
MARSSGGDMTEPPGDHGREDRSAAEKRRAGVDAHHQVEAFGGGFHHVAPEHGPGVVHEDVDAPEPIDGPRHHRLDLRFVADVEFDRQRLGAQRRDLVGDGVDRAGQRLRLFTLRGDDDAAPGPGQPQGARTPNPPARPRDNGDPTL